MPVGILSTGSYVPKKEVSNAEVAARVGVTPEWIERKTQIRTRRYAAPSQAASDLAVKAAHRALLGADLDAADLDYVIVSTSTGDAPSPPTANLVQDALGADHAACFDLNVVCSGFVYGLALARSLLRLHPGRRALVIAADVYSRILDFTDHRTAVLFADGAGAAILGEVPDGYGVLDVDLRSRGDAHHLIGVPAGGSRLPASHATVAAGRHYFRMDGRSVSDFVLAHVPAAVEAFVRRTGLELDEIDHFIPHQGNGNLMTRLVEAAGLGKARTHRTIDRFANMGSASVAVTLDHAVHDLNDGDTVLLVGFGGGISVGACLLRWADPWTLRRRDALARSGAQDPT
ncbi:3-oxoacyl-ACP synthase III family protein [Actinomadura flavalba]|uniref:3-oxoacyl-ACP synthase III family protein n=1 Tax=Actinomadura flavalba TaxID=1120938 RepID=UPI0006878F14|nr:ketoacyl-ACP synthase III [Actinomadura flavalba]